MAKDTLIEDYSNTGKRLINGLSKPDIKELLELAKAVQEKPYRLDKSDEYVRKFDPDKMIALLEYVRELESTINKARIFVDDVMPQIGGICLQDYANMNELCMALTRLEKANEL